MPIVSNNASASAIAISGTNVNMEQNETI